MNTAGLGRLLFSARRRLGVYRDVRNLKKRVRQSSPLRIVVGAGGLYDLGWIPTDVDVLDILDDAHWRRLFRENSIDAILAEHVWEHLTAEQGLRAAQNCNRFLRPGGYLRAAVPDGFHPDPTYLERVRPGGSGAGAQDHKLLYNHETFRQLFESAGFQVEPLEYFDSAGQFYAANWDPALGKIDRSQRFDERNKQGQLVYTSVILDARKPS
ncbi:MAG TPA: methyltransferase domain-containing protein [Planctomycetaceae bacterium]|jgi:predicted SAM-dependent methyltransferase|nr:methyltransferase domain-containing protein [Planctomycetaceae bacterium]